MPARKFIRDSLGFAATQYLIRAMLVVRSIVAARLLGPLPYGAWNALQLVMDYGTTLPPMGTLQGLDQSVPARILEGDAGHLRRLERAGLFNILVLTVLFVCAWLLTVFLRPSRFLGYWGPSGLLLAVLAIVLTNVAFYHMTLLRSHGNIHLVSGWFFLQGVIGTALGLALIPGFGAWGLLAGWTIGTAAATVMIRLKGRHLVPIVPRPGAESMSLVRVGLPMFVFIASTQVMRTFDRLIILRFLGTLSLGYYSMSVMALSFMLYLPDSIAYVLYPRLLNEFRRQDRQPEAIRGHVERSLGVLSVLMPALCGVAYLLARETIGWVLPKFLPGLTAVRVLCFGAAGLALANLSSIVLMTLGRQIVLVPVAIGMTALGAALDYAAVRSGWGINGVARVTLVTYLLNGGVLLWLALGRLRAPGPWREHLVARAFGPLLLAFVLAYGLDKVLPWSPGLPRTLMFLRLLAALAIFGVAYGVAISPLVRGLGMRQLVREFYLMLPRAPRRAEPAPDA